MKRHAQEMLEKKVEKGEVGVGGEGRERRRKTISITQEKESLVGVI